jgi:hypothetical protein
LCGGGVDSGVVLRGERAWDADDGRRCAPCGALAVRRIVGVSTVHDYGREDQSKKNGRHWNRRLDTPAGAGNRMATGTLGRFVSRMRLVAACQEPTHLNIVA